MGSSIDSSAPALRESTTGGSPLGHDLPFLQPGACSRKALEEGCPALLDVSDEERVYLAPQHLPTSPAPKAPEAPGSSRLAKLYEKDFRRLERGLEALKEAKQANVPLPKVRIHKGHVPPLEAGKGTEFHVPSSVPEGNVPALGVVDVKAEGELVFGSVLEERKAGLRK